SSDLPDGGIAGGSSHTATAGMAIHNAGADAIAKLADLATSDSRSPLYGAGNAGVVARSGRLVRRDDPSRSESYADILGRAGLAQIEGRGTGGNPNPMEVHAQSDYAMHALGIKGVGEIGITGTAGAVTNAVWHATGIRVRKFPITLDRLIEPL